jgi:two-component system chemotaxis response regulator CheB
MNSKIRVLVVDDSALARQMLTDLLNQQPGIEVVGSAQDGSFVIQKINQLQPDVITLDVEMRKIGGLEILPEIVRTFKLPVIMVSAHTERGAHATMRALELGAVDFVTKPQAIGIASIQEIVSLLAQKIIAVAGSRRYMKFREPLTPPVVMPSVVAAPTVKKAPNQKMVNMDMIAIGASTGGTEAIKDVLVGLPNTLPGIVIVQHMPAGFTLAFANRLNSLSEIHVKEASDGDEVAPGTALIAPGSHHMILRKGGGRYRVQLLETEPVNRHRPSVDVLFYSVAKDVGNRSMGIILTGMGGDGSQGLKMMRDCGAVTIAQDEASCVVFGMPKEAIKLDGAQYILPLDDIAPFLVNTVRPLPKMAWMAGSNN